MQFLSDHKLTKVGLRLLLDVNRSDETIGEFLVEPNLVERIVDVANVADVFYDTYVALKMGPKRHVVVSGSYGNFFEQTREKMAQIGLFLTILLILKL